MNSESVVQAYAYYGNYPFIAIGYNPESEIRCESIYKDPYNLKTTKTYFLHNSTVTTNPKLESYIAMPYPENGIWSNTFSFCQPIVDKSIASLKSYGTLCTDVDLLLLFDSIVSEKMTMNSVQFVLTKAGRLVTGTTGYLEFLQKTDNPDPLLYIYQIDSRYRNILEICQFKSDKSGYLYENDIQYQIICSPSINDFFYFVSIIPSDDTTMSIILA